MKKLGWFVAVILAVAVGSAQTARADGWNGQDWRRQPQQPVCEDPVEVAQRQVHEAQREVSRLQCAIDEAQACLQASRAQAHRAQRELDDCGRGAVRVRVGGVFEVRFQDQGRRQRAQERANAAWRAVRADEARLQALACDLDAARHRLADAEEALCDARDPRRHDRDQRAGRRPVERRVVIVERRVERPRHGPHGWRR
jgi:hypothetical protein